MKLATRIVRVLIAAGLALTGTARSCGELSAAEAPNLRIVYNALGGSMAPIWVSQELGLFAKHGLQHNLNYLGATTAVQAMAAGSEEIGLVGNQGIDMALEGADTVYVASTVPRFIFRLYGDPLIQTVGDLKGKVVAATQPKESAFKAMGKFLKTDNRQTLEGYLRRVRGRIPEIAVHDQGRSQSGLGSRQKPQGPAGEAGRLLRQFLSAKARSFRFY